ncbi:hypothetical protein HOY80DRAFT_1020078 [Tuber brumale]|nr:hypothetical protein HOY80DRAFT_1020078 [Tuber brumale]
MAADMNGELKVRLDGNGTVNLKVGTVWARLLNPLMDPHLVPGGVQNHSDAMRGKSALACVRLEGLIGSDRPLWFLGKSCTGKNAGSLGGVGIRNSFLPGGQRITVKAY